MFIYERTECEFSGIMTMYVADLFTETQAGMRLGFNEKDELEYYMFRGTGKVVGQLAYLEPFDDHGDKPMVVQAQSDPQSPGKGQRLVYRPIRDFQYMTDEEVHQAALKKHHGIRRRGRCPPDDGRKQYALHRHAGRQGIHPPL